MKTILQNSIALAATALLLATATSQAQTAYTIGNNGTSLVRFDLATPGATTLVGNFSGLTVGGVVDGIDFRPANGLLYGYSQGTNSVYTINPTTAAATLVTTPSVASTTDNLGIDFNPVADRLRLVNVNDQNLRINLAGGATASDTAFSAASSINEVAYTNNDNNPSTTTTQLYYIDFASDTLLLAANANLGPFNTVGSLGFDTTNFTGFDILSDGLGTSNLAFALLTAQSGVASLHSINLATGAATSLGTISQTAASRPHGLAIVPPTVPEPGTALFGLAILGAAFTRSRRTTVSA